MVLGAVVRIIPAAPGVALGGDVFTKLWRNPVYGQRVLQSFGYDNVNKRIFVIQVTNGALSCM